MNWNISQATKPKYFISYSRKQFRIADQLRIQMQKHATHIWQDRDEIVVGAHWLKEVEKGILEADEFVLLVSDDSMASSVVEHEVSVANNNNRTIKPFVVGPLTKPVPQYLAKFHLEELQPMNGTSVPLGELLYSNYDGSNKSAKECLGQRIFPEFSDPKIPEYRALLEKLAPLALDLANFANSGSVATLNAGLILSQLGSWDESVQYLLKYARSKNHPVGWYYLATHCCCQHSIVHMPEKHRTQAMEAYDRLLVNQSHPLSNFVCLLIEVGLLNHSAPSELKRLTEENQRKMIIVLSAQELHRLAWLTGNSFSLLGPQGVLLKNLIKQALV